jgi:hypothetical protein
MGALGAGFSLIVRIGSFPADPAAGRNLHTREALARFFVGIMGAFVAYLALGTKQLLPAFTDASIASLLLVAFVAGTSERFVPNLISRVEGGAETPKTPDAGEKSTATKTK